ncbi:M23 family metallopeptidase [Thiobaca trueperi]|nr:M23 family metallopeptidase [Thiobaca trueperi]
MNKTMISRALMIFLLFFPLSVSGKKLYKFQDENGQWFFTDREPKTEKEVIITRLDVAPRERIKLLRSGNDNQADYSVHNDYAGPVEIEFNLSEVENASAIPKLPRRFVVNSGNSGILVQIRRINQTRPWLFRLKYQYVVGRPLKNYSSVISYLPPIAPGSSFRISQSFGGKFSHTDQRNYYAVDILMPEGTPLYAARKGVVMSVDNDFYKNGLDKKHLPEANSIRILHDDGSMAVYVHLQFEGAQVVPGVTVQAGQFLGYSGNTGFSSEPHLHFAVQINQGMALASVPFRFINKIGQAEDPVPGKMLDGVTGR